ncbi:polysaccharide deacetylase family protein [Bacteroidales bacterium OttesenSCG-928-I21]|nr:polysaccharide deacetylase family protein [Bacteroidales bacterium OttesenSCG-928-I21]
MEKKTMYFFLLGEFSRFDKNISPRNKNMQKLITNLSADDCIIGLHPSWKGNSDYKLWKNERNILEKILKTEINYSRQHYICVSFPKTYEILVNLEIEQDFSMIYHDLHGFRLGTTVPIPFFNLSTNKKNDLWLYPTMIMDVGLARYQKLIPEDAINESLKIINYVKEFGGTLVTLWHNESLSEYGEWQGWSKVYEEILKIATN